MSPFWTGFACGLGAASLSPVLWFAWVALYHRVQIRKKTLLEALGEAEDSFTPTL